MNRKPRIAVVGSYAVGMTMSCARFPKSGETVRGSGFKALHGGKGSNQAIAVARLGGEAVYCGCVGNDSFGEAAVAMLNSEGVDTTYVVRSADKPTGVGFVVVDATGSNEIVIDLGANEALAEGDVEKMEESMAGCGLLLVQLEANLQAVFRAMELAHRRNVPIILNPAPFQPVPERIVKMASYITPNETEALEMLGKDPVEPCSGPELARELHRRFGVASVVTLGKDGVHIADEGLDLSLPTYEIKVADTTGAGDTFSAALAVALGEGLDLVRAADFANKAASLSVSKEGVVESIPTREAVDGTPLRKKEIG